MKKFNLTKLFLKTISITRLSTPKSHMTNKNPKSLDKYYPSHPNKSDKCKN